jgi:hypothetical protein
MISIVNKLLKILAASSESANGGFDPMEFLFYARWDSRSLLVLSSQFLFM